jgi:hypothetical protein
MEKYIKFKNKDIPTLSGCDYPRHEDPLIDNIIRANEPYQPHMIYAPYIPVIVTSFPMGIKTDEKEK